MFGFDDHTAAMGVKVGAEALRRAGVDFLEVDLVLLVFEEYKEQEELVNFVFYFENEKEFVIYI